MGLTITDLSISGMSRRVRENFRLAPSHSDFCLIPTRDEFGVPPSLHIMARRVSGDDDPGDESQVIADWS
jgi:hypothetical protein